MVAVVGIGTYGVVVTNAVDTGCHCHPGGSGCVVDAGSGVVMVVGGSGGRCHCLLVVVASSMVMVVVTVVDAGAVVGLWVVVVVCPL